MSLPRSIPQQFIFAHGPTKLDVIEQNYEYDLLDPQELCQKYLGHEITLIRAEKDTGSTRWVETKARLLADGNGPVWRIGNEIVTGMSADSFRFPDLSDNLYSRPTLVWTLENRGADSQRVEASYLMSNENWNADYVLTVGRDEKKADLDGWVTLVNISGIAYDNAKLQLVAGEIHRAATGTGRVQVYSKLQAPSGGAAIYAGGILRISPLHAWTPHVDLEQRVETDPFADRNRRSRRKVPLA